MATLLGDVGLQLLFGRAFLLELERGNVERAAVFARAFLRQRSLPGPGFSDDATPGAA